MKYTSSFLKKIKVTEAHQRSVLQLMSVINRDEKKDLVRAFKANAKTHSTLEETKFIPLYAEHVQFLVKKARWLDTRISQYFTFEQSKFKKILLL